MKLSSGIVFSFLLGFLAFGLSFVSLFLLANQPENEVYIPVSYTHLTLPTILRVEASSVPLSTT